ncbi:MAG: response regulator transcription factor [Rickettsiales bacterium]|jgi:two-component system phosphate regulon response regulator OmpR|nr:response regulator transcription factor [Rickettsiales bacterium]
MGSWHILLIDDDDRIRGLLGKYLAKNEFLVSGAGSVAEARRLREKYIFDLMIVDYLMPVEDGLSFISELRESGDRIPIVMLTALNDVTSRIEVLSCGADDYLPKPFEPKELVLRMLNILKRVNTNVSEYGRICFGDFVFHPFENELFRNDAPVKLTDTEGKILKIFCDSANKVLTRGEICDAFGNDIGKRTIDVQITRLRKKIEGDTKSPKFLKTIRNGGYIFMLRG